MYNAYKYEWIYKNVLMKLIVWFFLIKNEKLLEKHNKIWDKPSYSIGKEFDIELVYNEKYMETKIKSYESKINTNFHVDGIPGSHWKCLSVMLTDFVFKIG